MRAALEDFAGRAGGHKLHAAGIWRAHEQQKRTRRARRQTRRTGAGRGAQAFTRGLAALAQYVEREQRGVVPRQHTEQVTVDGQEHEVRLGVWVSNQNSRRDKLSAEQLGQLAELGMDRV
ncbi:helicase associated domain-containing protein [Streptomyces sp. NPDC050485]|uniref:helicase associated domain-containing protein n=1 Tax=Streptomyces sp. NPDC050485 TaxID=3365617 RepID=UPI00378843C0